MHMNQYYKTITFREAGANSYWQLRIFNREDAECCVVAFHTSKDRNYLVRLALERWHC